MYRKIRRYNSDIHVYELNPRKQRINTEFGIKGKLEPLSKIGQPGPGEKVAAKINATFFGGKSEHDGPYIRQGLWYGTLSEAYLGVVLTKEYKLIFEKITDLQRAAYWQGNAFWVIGGSFTLTIDGRVNLTNITPFPHWKEEHPRTAVGQKVDGNIVLVVVDGRSSANAGVTGKELAEIMLELGCVNSINLDGGDSSEMIVDDKIINKPSGGSERPIGAALVVYEEVETLKTVYLASSVQKNNIGVGNYGNEMDRCFELADLLQPLLEYNGIKVYRNTKTMSLWDAINDGNTKKPDIYVSLHTNARGSGVKTKVRGGSVYCYLISGRKTNSQILGECVLEELLRFNYKFSTGIMDGVKPKLAEIISTNPTSCIVEHIFHDDPDDVELFINNMHKFAEADAKGICKYFGIEYKQPPRRNTDYEEILKDLQSIIDKYS